MFLLSLVEYVYSINYEEEPDYNYIRNELLWQIEGRLQIAGSVLTISYNQDVKSECHTLKYKKNKVFY